MSKKNQNATLERLSGTPFTSARELNNAQDDIRMKVWKRLEEAKVVDELLRRGEYEFWKDEFKEGLVCRYGEQQENLVRVFSEGRGIKININKALAESSSSSEVLLGVLIKSMSEAFANTYYKAKGILPADHLVKEEDKRTP